MTMSPRVRKLGLALHVVSSIGWMGALAAFLALSIVGLTSGEPRTVRAAYIAASLITALAILPLALVALVSGVIQALGSGWGLRRHYWVVFKLVIVTTAAFMLWMKAGPIASLASAAAEGPLSAADLRGLRLSVLGHAVGGLLVLLWAALLGFYKPQGLTRYGWRKQHERG
jgi:hypothetical protein